MTETLERFVKRPRLPRDDAQAGIAHVTVHDLRRTAATHMTKLGVPRLHVSCVLNHAQRGVTAQVYDRYEYLEEKRRALETWAAQMTALCH